MERAPKNERGGGGGEGGLFPTPTPLVYLPQFSRSLRLVPHSLPETAWKCLLHKLYTCTLINMVFMCLGTIATTQVHTTNR